MILLVYAGSESRCQRWCFRAYRESWGAGQACGGCRAFGAKRTQSIAAILVETPADRRPRLDILLRALRPRRFLRQLVLRLAILCSRQETSDDFQ